MNKTQQRLRVLNLLIGVMGFSLFLNAFGQDKERPRGIIPVDLDLLFSALPDKVEGWELTRSKGWRGHYRWMESIVIREFETVIEEGAAKEVVPQKVRISVKDTCKFADSDLELFADFTPNKGDAVERLYVETFPAVITEKESKVVAQFLLKERFILNITFYDLPKRELASWFRKVKVASLANVKDGPIIELPASMVELSVDELKETKKSVSVSLEEPDDGEGLE